MTILILALLLAFSISFTCSLLEAALLSLSNTDIAQISDKNPHVAKIWTDFKEKIHRPITVILVVNTLAHTIGATVAGAQFNSIFGDKMLWIFSLGFSFVMIIWTEIMPKTLGVKYKKKISIISGRPLKFLVIILDPIVVCLGFLSNPFRKKDEKSQKFNPLEEISVLAQFAAGNQQISSEQEKIVARGLGLSHKKVKEIMVMRHDMAYLSTEMKLIDALIKIHISRHTRYILVHDNNLDNIIGYVNFKDIVSALHVNPKNASLRGISRPILTVKEEENLANILSKLIKGYQHIAVVIDKEGKTTGMITMEDVIEAVVGQMGDEYDVVPNYVYKNSEDSYVAAGGAILQQLEEETNFGFPKENKLIGEWIREINGDKMPTKDQRLIYGKIRISIMKIRRGKINEIMIERISGG